MKKNRKKTVRNHTNRNARIENRVTVNGKFRTETMKRDDEFHAAISTDPTSHATSLYIDFGVENFNWDESVALTGSQARTLYRLLNSHFDYTGKPSPR